MATDPAERLRIGSTLKALREAQGLTIAGLAREIEVSPTLVSLIESGDRRATPLVLQALAERLDVPVSTFTGSAIDQLKAVADKLGVEIVHAKVAS